MNYLITAAFILLAATSTVSLSAQVLPKDPMAKEPAPAPAVKKSKPAVLGDAKITVKPDFDCTVYVDNLSHGLVKAGQSILIEMPKGTYLVKAISAEFGNMSVEEHISVNNGETYKVTPTLQEKIAERKRATEEKIAAESRRDEKAEERYLGIPNPNNADLYNWGMANYKVGYYRTADSIFCRLYISKYPNEIYGYLWCARSKYAEDDSVESEGLAVNAFEKLVDIILKTDPDTYKSQLINAYGYLATWYWNYNIDRERAIGYMEKLVALDPSNTKYAGLLEVMKKQRTRK